MIDLCDGEEVMVEWRHQVYHHVALYHPILQTKLDGHDEREVGDNIDLNFFHGSGEWRCT